MYRHVGWPRKVVRLALAWLFVGASAAQAGESCPAKVTAAVAKSAGVKPKGKPAEAVVSAACKLWPYDGKTVLSAIAFDEGEPEQKTLVVAMADAGSGRVLRVQTTPVTEDAAVEFGEGSLSIDTAPYQLAKDVRAFGIRFTSSAHGPSCADAAWRDELTLFVPDGETLRPVLEGLNMTQMVARKNCMGAGMDVVFDEATLALGLAPTSTKGLADLVVTAQIRRESTRSDGTGKPKIERATLRYDGKAYRSAGKGPWWLGFSSSFR